MMEQVANKNLVIQLAWTSAVLSIMSKHNGDFCPQKTEHLSRVTLLIP